MIVNGGDVTGFATGAVPVPSPRKPDQVTVGYRTIFRTTGEDVVGVAERHVRAWLAQKLGGATSLDDWDGVSSARFDDQFSIVVASQGEVGRTQRRLYRLIDQNPRGRFEISLYAAGSANGGHLVIEGARDAATTEAAIDGVATPNIVRQILDDVTILDGSTAVTGRPHVIRSGDESDVIDAIVDDARSMSVIVASSLTADVDDRWLALVDQLTRYSVGVATVFVVYADAVDEMNRRLPATLQIPPGQIRTFAPGVRLDDPDDGIVHRFLGPATFARAIRNGRVGGALPAVHARASRLRLLERAVPADARRTIDLLARAERAEQRAITVKLRVAEAPVEAPDVDLAVVQEEAGGPSDERNTVAPEKSTPASTTATEQPTGIQAFIASIRRLLQKWVRRSEISRDSIAELDAFVTVQVTEVAVATEQIDEVASENEALRRQLEELREVVEGYDFDSALTADELRALDHENQRLKRRLRESQIFFVPDDTPVEWEPPPDVEELIARITPGAGEHSAYARVVFTGSLDPVLEVGKRDGHGKYARDLWNFVRVLFEYAELKTQGGFQGNVHMYLADDTVAGHKCNPQRHAGTESDTVLGNPTMRAERVHPVPTDVDESGFALMDAHFKPTHRDMFAPRMHYYDDTNNTGKIYIGYIGRHLSTTQSA